MEQDIYYRLTVKSGGELAGPGFDLPPNLEGGRHPDCPFFLYAIKMSDLCNGFTLSLPALSEANGVKGR